MSAIKCEHCGTPSSLDEQKFCEECGNEFNKSSSASNSGKSRRLKDNENNVDSTVKEEIDSDPEVQALKEKLAKAEAEAERRVAAKRNEEKVREKYKSTEAEIARLKNELSYAEGTLKTLSEELKFYDGECVWFCENCEAPVEKTSNYCTACDASFFSTRMVCTSCVSGEHSRVNNSYRCTNCNHRFSYEQPRTLDGKCPKCLKYPFHHG